MTTAILLFELIYCPNNPLSLWTEHTKRFYRKNALVVSLIARATLIVMMFMSLLLLRIASRAPPYAVISRSFSALTVNGVATITLAVFSYMATRSGGSTNMALKLLLPRNLLLRLSLLLLPLIGTCCRLNLLSILLLNLLRFVLTQWGVGLFLLHLLLLLLMPLIRFHQLMIFNLNMLLCY